jgi:hypothetical protein
MRNHGNIYVHVIDEKAGTQLLRRLVTCVPKPGDEIRVGGAGAEKYYRVTRVIWVFDEPDNPYERANVGVELCA